MIRKPYTVAGLVFFSLTVLCLLVIGLAPSFRQPGFTWGSWPCWKQAVVVGWPGVAAAIYLKYAEKIKGQRAAAKRSLKNRTARKLASLWGITEICNLSKQSQFDWERLRSARESILTALGHSVEELLGLSDNDRVAVSLLDFSTGNMDTMRVVARSNKDRPVGAVYAVSKLVAWEAIRTGAVCVQDDVRRNPRWDSIGERRYRSVISIPITLNDRAFGAVSLDSEKAYAFYGRGKEIALQIAPYVGVLALTYGPNGVSCDCKYDPTHF